MRLTDIINELDLSVLVGEDLENVNVEGVYICDLLSNVMANGQANDLWITIQTHQNVLAVASLLNFSAILLPGGFAPEQGVLAKAREEGVVILQSPLSSFELAGRLYELGLRGR